MFFPRFCFLRGDLKPVDDSQSSPFIVIGLGNPGTQYAKTRHNIGFMVLDRLAEEHRVSWDKGVLKNSLLGKVRSSEFSRRMLLVKPRTYMNRSGRSAGEVIRKFEISPGDLTVVYDDLNLPLGMIRLRSKGSAGGHNGIKSIMEVLGTDEFQRVRLGIGIPDSPALWHDFVLSRFGRDEMAEVEEMVSNAREAIETICQDGFLMAMNTYNKKVKEMED